MSTTSSAAPPKKNLTPAQTAKPLGSSNKTSTSAAAKKTEPEASETASKDDTTKAMEKLQTQTKAVNANNVARVANSQLATNDEKLQPMLSLKTGQPIDKFPATSKEIEKLSLTTLDSILNQLEADRSGNEAVKREKLRLQLGLKPNPA